MPPPLSPEVLAIINQEAPEGACYREQPVCDPDARVTAQLRWEEPVEMVLPWHVAGAQKGDLLLTPGGTGGLIGTLLAALQPPQLFSHMGIFTRDEVELRHCTVLEAWLRSHSQGVVHDLGVPAVPSDGFKEDALRHGWPGTVTQSVEDVHLSEIQPKAQKKRYVDADAPPVLGVPITYPIAELGFASSLIRRDPKDELKSVIPALLVTTAVENDRVRDALHRIADEVLRLRGHYRFYAYSDAQISENPAYLGPKRLDAEALDPRCSGLGGNTPDFETRAMMCSSLIWTAVQEANKRAAVVGGPTQIVLDGRDPDHAAAQGPSAYWPQHPRESAQGQGTADGLYVYSEVERMTAAKTLHDRIVEDTFAAEQALLSGAGFVSDLLGDLIEAFTDMADDVANQITNAFASDDCTTDAKDSDAWQQPGAGVSVSPDDILNDWTPFDAERSTDSIIGVYGMAVPIALRPPEYTASAPAPSTWQETEGPAGVMGVVSRRLADGSVVRLPGAHVRVGCHKWMTVGGGLFDGPHGVRQVDSGIYYAKCWWRDPQTMQVNAVGRPVRVEVNRLNKVDFLLDIPPVRRRVWFEGHLDLVNRKAVGKDWWDHPQILTPHPALVTWGVWPTPAQQQAAANMGTGVGSGVDDWGSCEINCDATVDPLGNISAHVTARLRHDDDDDPLQFDEIFPIAPGQNQPLIFDMVRDPDAWPVRAHCEIVIHNDIAY